MTNLKKEVTWVHSQEKDGLLLNFRRRKSRANKSTLVMVLLLIGREKARYSPTNHKSASKPLTWWILVTVPAHRIPALLLFGKTDRR